MKNAYEYLHIGSGETAWDFFITTAGYHKNPENVPYPLKNGHPADHSFSWNKGRILDGYYIVFITDGCGVFESEKTAPKNIAAGTCFLLFPGIWHRYKPDPKEGWEEFWVGFNGSYPAALMNKFFKPDDPFIQTGFNQQLLSEFQTLIEHMRETPKRYPQLYIGIVLKMIGILESEREHESLVANPVAQMVAKVVFQLQNSLDKQVSLETLASSFPISYSKFRKAFKEITGKSPNQYHLDLRLGKALELLKATSLTIGEIAFKTGFESLFYFSRMIKRKYGQSPKQLRGASIKIF